MQKEIYPLTFKPVFRDYIWGGRRLETLFGRELPPGIVAESWEISGHNSSATLVANGLWQGHPLSELLDVLATDLVGTRSEAMLKRHRFPLLIKLLDAEQELSVQVHPDDAYARVYENGELGKTEVWYVLHAEPGAQLVYGLAKGVTRESFTAAYEQGDIRGQLHYADLAVGDCYSVPAGTIHALLAGAVVAEIQQNSDVTYRVYDWDRVEDDGQPRELHVAKALNVINWSQITPGKAEPVLLSDAKGCRRELLTTFPQFTLEQITLDDGAQFTGACDGATFQVWGCVEGSGSVVWQDGSVRIDAVGWALLPAALGGFAIQAETQSTFLRAYIGD